MSSNNRGDTIDITLAYTINGEPITEGQFDEIEVYVGENRYTLTGGDIVWDNEQEMYTIFIDQEDSFKLTTKTEYQTRFKIGVNVISSKIKYIPIGKTLSNEVI